MSGLQFNVFCEIDPDLTVTAKVDSDGDIWIGLSNATDRAMLTLDDAKALSRFLASAVSKQEAIRLAAMENLLEAAQDLYEAYSKQVTSVDWDQDVTRKAAAAIKRARS